MKKVYITLFLICIYCCFTFVQAEGYKPLVTGNYEQGHRLYDLEEGGDYFFRDGWVKWKQKLSSTSYYYFKLHYGENLYQNDQYDNTTIDLTTNYTYQLFDPLRLKTILTLKEKEYLNNHTKDYLEVDSSLEFSYRPGKKDHLLWTLGYQQENYDLSNKSNSLTGFTFRWERKIWQGFSIHSKFKYTNQNYFAEDSLSDKMRESISVGFEYQL